MNVHANVRSYGPTSHMQTATTVTPFYLNLVTRIHIRTYMRTYVLTLNDIYADNHNRDSLLSELGHSDIQDIASWLNEPGFRQYCLDVEKVFCGCVEENVFCVCCKTSVNTLRSRQRFYSCMSSRSISLMMIALITSKSSLVPLLKCLCSLNPFGFEVSVLCRFCLFMSSSFVLFLCVSARAYLYTRVCVCLCIHICTSLYVSYVYMCISNISQAGRSVLCLW